MDDEAYFWDMIIPELMRLFSLWAEPMVGLNRRQTVAMLFAVRAMRRALAVTGLFKGGFYLESHALVRAGYEDWLYLAYLMREPGSDRSDEWFQGIRKIDARVYDAFSQLCGVENANRFFGEPPDAVSVYVGLPRSETRSPSFAAMADDVGLRAVHNFAYSYLSGQSHPDGRVNHIFDQSESLQVARIPARAKADEMQLALWISWFTSRIAVLACREFGVDQEWFGKEYLLPLTEESGVTIETCILVREANGA